MFTGSDSALRVYVESDRASISAPVLIVVRYKKGVLSWQLPMETQDPDDSRSVEIGRAHV